MGNAKKHIMLRDPMAHSYWEHHVRTQIMDLVAEVDRHLVAIIRSDLRIENHSTMTTMISIWTLAVQSEARRIMEDMTTMMINGNSLCKLFDDEISRICAANKDLSDFLM